MKALITSLMPPPSRLSSPRRAQGEAVWLSGEEHTWEQLNELWELSAEQEEE